MSLTVPVVDDLP